MVVTNASITLKFKKKEKIIKDTFIFKSSDNNKKFSHKWLPEGKTGIKAIVQIAHGMAEHSARYEGFANELVKNNFGVYANDHRGHGKTAGNIENLGFFADKNGWDLVVNDMAVLTDIIKSNHPDVPVFLLGHSMGSLLSRDYIFSYPGNINGVILCATASDPVLDSSAGIVFSKIESIFRGKKAESPLMDKLFFKGFNKPFKPNRTKFDWLTRDNKEIDKYIDDPYCGTLFKTGFFNDFLKGLKKVSKPSNIQKIPRDLPVYIFSGSMDPVGGFTKGVKKVYQAYSNAGIKDLTLKFYKDGRHEMLNEINRQEVYKDIINWLERRITN